MKRTKTFTAIFKGAVIADDQALPEIAVKFNKLQDPNGIPYTLCEFELPKKFWEKEKRFIRAYVKNSDLGLIHPDKEQKFYTSWQKLRLSSETSNPEQKKTFAPACLLA